MEKITFKVEAITPIFIAGADQKIINNEGLRAPSLKGLMRWWFRAIMGGMVPLKNLKVLESKLYGDTNQRSKIKIFSRTNSSPSNIEIPRELQYLWFSINLQKRNKQRLECYRPGSNFEILLSSIDEFNHKIATACLWLMIFLGGIGSRMRRCAGSLKIKNISNNDIPYDFNFDGKTVNDLKRFIEDNLELIFIDFKSYAKNNYNPPSNFHFPVLSNGEAEIALISKLYNEYQLALNMLSKHYKNFRIKIARMDRYTFGLPILAEKQFRDKRHASPLFFGVSSINNKYAIRIIKFFSSRYKDFLNKSEDYRRDLNNFDNAIKRDELIVNLPKG